MSDRHRPSRPPQTGTSDRLPTPEVRTRVERVDTRAAGPMAANPTPRPVDAAVTQIHVSQFKSQAAFDPRLILAAEPDSPRAARFRVLRHRVLETGGPRTIAVASARPGEGKTTCAVNLAIALGECDRARVLLVEANLRAPALAGLFGFQPPECFAQQLARHRERPLEPWSVVEVRWPWFHVAAVRPDFTPGPLLDGPAFAIAMDRLRLGGYDYIVVDSPPVLDSADVNLIQDSVDGVLLTAWARRSSGRELRQAAEQLAAAKLLGIALLDV